MFFKSGKNSDSTMFTKDKLKVNGRSHGGRGGAQSSGVRRSAWLENKTADPSKFSLFSSVVVWLCAAYANIVLLLCSLSRQSDADLVKPLVTAAITLDPVHLKRMERTFEYYYLRL